MYIEIELNYRDSKKREKKAAAPPNFLHIILAEMLIITAKLELDQLIINWLFQWYSYISIIWQRNDDGNNSHLMYYIVIYT